MKKRLADIPMLLIGLCIISLSLMGLAKGACAVYDGVVLASRGQVAQATVTNLYTTESDGSTDYHIIYAYTPPGAQKPHKRSTTISSGVWRATCGGCKIELRYDPERPQVSRLPSERPLLHGLGLTALAGVFLVIGLAFVWFRAELGEVDSYA
jgi:hypothetical protein